MAVDVSSPRPLTDRDLPAAAALHASELPDGFFAELGPRFLRRYLATFLDGTGTVALAVDGADGELAGFLVGSTRDGHHRAALRRHGRSLALAGALALLTRPGLAWRFLRTRAGRYVRAVRRTPAPAPVTPAAGRTAVLLHIAVAPELRGSGRGAALVRGLEQAARQDGCDRAVLVSFGDKPFYEKLGWQRGGARRGTGGADVVTYRRTL